MSAKTISCEDRFTWLTFINGSENTYSYIVDLEAVQPDIIDMDQDNNVDEDDKEKEESDDDKLSDK